MCPNLTQNLGNLATKIRPPSLLLARYLRSVGFIRPSTPTQPHRPAVAGRLSACWQTPNFCRILFVKFLGHYLGLILRADVKIRLLHLRGIS